jgi:hypothetical protein
LAPAFRSGIGELGSGIEAEDVVAVTRDGFALIYYFRKS